MSISIRAVPCTKADFFRLIDDGYVPKKPIKFHLKYIQDVFANYEVQKVLKKAGLHDVVVGEIGANHSRILPCLHQMSARLYAIDVYDRSIGGGYTEKPKTDGYEIIECLVGDSDNLIKDETFDVLFSVSVVENVPAGIWDRFWIDQLRILKEGGTAIHLVDYYCDMDGPLAGVIENVYRSLSGFDNSFVYTPEDWSFRTSWCSNDDYTMYQWCKCAPSLSSIRLTHQSCSMLLKITKTCST